MALTDDDIEQLLRGDLSDIEDFDDTDNVNDESDIIKAFEDMDNFILQNGQLDSILVSSFLIFLFTRFINICIWFRNRHWLIFQHPMK